MAKSAKTENQEDKHRVSKTRHKSADKKRGTKEKKSNGVSSFSLLAQAKSIDPKLSLLFEAKETSTVPKTVSAGKDIIENTSHDEKRISFDLAAEQDGSDTQYIEAPDEQIVRAKLGEQYAIEGKSHRKRRRKPDEPEIEDLYMQRLAVQEAKDAKKNESESHRKRLKVAGPEGNDDQQSHGEGNQAAAAAATNGVLPRAAGEVGEEENEDGIALSPPPKHETEQMADEELAKANRTVFLGNVSTAAITSKTAQKALRNHLQSFFPEVATTKPTEPKHAIESIRFRSTPYASSVPKKAAFAKKDLMDTTTKSTNAYVIYSSPRLASEACQHLNGSVVLDRHLRVDAVAHPAKVDHKRCVFVGNLGFVDDESNIQAANAEDGREKRKPGKEPGDVEEGLWRTFGKCGNVESVRVVRDSKTRVGKGIAYVQFEDANAVEAALLYEGKKFPPMLPRKLRVARAKAQKRNTASKLGNPSSKPSTNGYQRKITGEEASKMGRAGKLYGKAGAARVQRPGSRVDEAIRLPVGVKGPESFVFEGHRASSKSGKSGLKLGGKSKKKGRPTNRSAKRGAAFKAGTGKKG